ncbi:MAG: DUF5798 family protein [Halobacteria archaeon]|nr:DUF5798 family protein [Halobacteria archaeon]
MGLGTTAKRIQQLADLAENLVQQSKELRNRVIGLEESVDETGERVETLETQLEEQRAIIEAMAEQQGVDVDEAVSGVDTVDEDEDTGTA